MTTANKIYYDVNIANQTIIRVATKPKGFSADGTLAEMHMLLHRVVERPPQDYLSGKEKELTPGYTLLYIREHLSRNPIPAKDERPTYNLFTRATTINSIVNTIIDQYQKTYEKEACCLRKLLDRFLVWLGCDTPFTRMQRIQIAIRSDIETAQEQAARYIDYIYRD